MANQLVKILTDDDGEKKWDPKWCLVDPGNPGGPASLCTAEYFGFGESICTYEEKMVDRGGITCTDCLEKLKLYKAIRL